MVGKNNELLVVVLKLELLAIEVDQYMQTSYLYMVGDLVKTRHLLGETYAISTTAHKQGRTGLILLEFNVPLKVAWDQVLKAFDLVVVRTGFDSEAIHRV